MLNVAHQYQKATDWHKREPPGFSMNWEIVIGLETHAQLSTASKMFSGASTAFGAPPNTQGERRDIALRACCRSPNREAVAKAVCFGLAVTEVSQKHQPPLHFSRGRTTFTPSAQGLPDQSVRDADRKRGGDSNHFNTRGDIQIRLTRAHLEEDAGKSLHEAFTIRPGSI